MNTLIHNYSPPHDCLVCPFFKVNVANAGNKASLKCQLLGAEMSFDEIPYIREQRDPLCPMEEIE